MTGRGRSCFYNLEKGMPQNGAFLQYRGFPFFGSQAYIVKLPDFAAVFLESFRSTHYPIYCPYNRQQMNSAVDRDIFRGFLHSFGSLFRELEL